MSTFTTRTLGEICDEVGGTIRTGPFGSQLHESDYLSEGTPVVMPQDIAGGKVSIEQIARIGQADVSRLAQHKLHGGDIVYGRRGDIGRRALITKREDGWLCGTGCLRISLGDAVLDPLFLFYYLGQPKVVKWIANQAVGATLPNLNTTIIRSVEVKYPCLPIQRKIAGILAAYDELIENNTRRIEILEEMARGLYHEWFVRFRFPGYEGARMVDSALGTIPGGWEVKNLFDVADVTYGFPFRSELFTADQTGKPVIRIRDIPSNLSDTYTTEEANTRYIVKNKDILVGMDGLFHMCIWAGGEAYLNQRVVRFRPKDDMDVYYLFHALRHPIKLFESTITGTTVSHLGDKHLRTVSIIVPSSSVKNVAVRTFDALLTMEIDLKRTNLNLRRTRDLLLPRLVSGKVDVGRLELELAGVLNEEGSPAALAESR